VVTKVQVVLDCADPATLAEFWTAALGYRIPEPPEGFATWPDYLRASGVPESEWNSARAVEDPTGAGPRLFLQRVPEPKAGKNRMHLDLNVGGGSAVPLDDRRERVATEVLRLEALGGSRVREFDRPPEHWVVMRDPEGNEFCLQ
jgi:hypothetical protein